MPQHGALPLRQHRRERTALRLRERSGVSMRAVCASETAPRVPVTVSSVFNAPLHRIVADRAQRPLIAAVGDVVAVKVGQRPVTALPVIDDAVVVAVGGPLDHIALRTRRALRSATVVPPCRRHRRTLREEMQVVLPTAAVVRFERRGVPILISPCLASHPGPTTRGLCCICGLEPAQPRSDAVREVTQIDCPVDGVRGDLCDKCVLLSRGDGCKMAALARTFALSETPGNRCACRHLDRVPMSVSAGARLPLDCVRERLRLRLARHRHRRHRRHNRRHRTDLHLVLLCAGKCARAMG